MRPVLLLSLMTFAFSLAAQAAAAGVRSTSVVLVGDVVHLDPALATGVPKILATLESPGPRKCLVLEVGDDLEPALKSLIRHRSPEDVARINQRLARTVLPEVDEWIGDPIPLTYLDFAQDHDFKLYGGDMRRSKDYWDGVMSGQIKGDDETYTQMYLRNRYMAERIASLTRRCDLIAFVVGVSHLTESATLKGYGVTYETLPAYLAKLGVPSRSLMIGTHKNVEWFVEKAKASGINSLDAIELTFYLD